MRQTDLISILQTHPELKHFHKFIIIALYAMAKFWPFQNAAQALKIPDLFKPRNRPPTPTPTPSLFSTPTLLFSFTNLVFAFFGAVCFAYLEVLIFLFTPLTSSDI